MIVTPETNRISTFATAAGITPEEVVRYNLAYFIENRTMWLPVGDDFFVTPEALYAGEVLLIGDKDTELLVNDHILVVD